MKSKKERERERMYKRRGERDQDWWGLRRDEEERVHSKGKRGEEEKRGLRRNK